MISSVVRFSAVLLAAVLASGLRAETPAAPAPAESSLGTDGYAKSGDVRIHYVTRGQGPLLVMIHVLKDKALLAGALDGTWNWIDKDLTLVTVPDADHWVQQDAPELVTRTMVGWLDR